MRIAAVAIERVEVDEVGHEEAAVAQAGHEADDLVHHGGIARHFHFLARADMGVDVADLADGDDMTARIGQQL